MSNNAENNVNVVPQLTLRDVKEKISSIEKKAYEDNHPKFKQRFTYKNSMKIVKSIKSEIKDFYDDNMTNINDDELIKIYDYYVTDNKKVSEFFNASFTTITVSTINSISIGLLVKKIIDNKSIDYDGFFSDFISALIILAFSLIFAWFCVRSLNRDSYKYEIKEISDFHTEILS